MGTSLDPKLWLIAFALTSGCHEEPSPRDGRSVGITVTDSSDVVLVDNRGAPGARGWRRSPEPWVRIGDATGVDLARQFSFVRSTTRLSDGRIVVLDLVSREVRWFSETGDHLLTGAGAGEGPGELRAPLVMIALAGDTVVVEDRPRPKHVYFGPDGAFVGEGPLDYTRYASLEPGECGGRTLPDLSLLMCRQLPGVVAQPDPGPGHLRDSLRFVRTTWELGTRWPLGLYRGIEQWGVERSGRTDYILHPFFSTTHVAAGGAPMRIAIAQNPRYEIEVWTPEGRLERIVRRSDADRSPSPEEVAAGDSSMLRRIGDDRAFAGRVEREVELPDQLPAVMDLVVADDGALWVGRRLRLPHTVPSRYDVFVGEGRFAGTVDFPPGFDLHEVGEGYALGVRSDALDVQYVELYGLSRAR